MNENTQKKTNLEARAAKFDEELTRFKSIAWFNATNAAVEIVKPAYEKAFDIGADNEEMAKELGVTLRKAIKDHRDWIYKEHMEFFIREIIEEK